MEVFVFSICGDEKWKVLSDAASNSLSELIGLWCFHQQFYVMYEPIGIKDTSNELKRFPEWYIT